MGSLRRDIAHLHEFVQRYYSSQLHPVKPLGQGGKGDVFEYTCKRTGGPVAVKEIRSLNMPHIQLYPKGYLASPPPSSSDPFFADAQVVDAALWSNLQQLMSELKHLSKLRDNRRVIALLGACFEPRFVCLVMELAPLGSLAGALKDDGIGMHWDWGRRLGVLSDMVSAVHYIHSMDVRHGDIKPENFLVSKDGSVKLGDFGLSVYRPVVQGSSVSASVNVDHAASGSSGAWNRSGTPAYLAPELLLSSSGDSLETVMMLLPVACSL